MTKSAPAVLVADDQPAVVDALRFLLKGAGYDVDAASSGDALLGRLTTRTYDAVLMDLNYARDTTSGLEGLDLIARIHAGDPLLPIVAMTGWSTVETAVEAMRRGARAFVPKPWDNAALIEILRREIDEARAARRAGSRAARELEDAAQVQRALLPASLPELPSCSMAASWEPAATFGGDWYDAFRLGDRRVGFAIADVCGKGLPAALLMSNLQALVRALAEPGRAPHDVVSRVNLLLCRTRGLGRFVTFFFGIFDSATRVLAFCNAGHPPPFLLRGDGRAERLTAGGPLLGVFEESCFDRGETHLDAGDRLVLFTDGITEALDAGGEEFGDERLIEVARGCRYAAPAAMVASVLVGARDFARAGFQDDATLMAVAIER